MTHSHHVSSNRLAVTATLHCLTGCSIGEVLGMMLGAGLHWSNTVTVAVSVVLAFMFGYALTLRPLFRAGMNLGRALRLAFASDTISITIMEIVDNALMLTIPGAMDAHFLDPLFWISMVVSLVAAGILAYPVNRWLIVRGKGHALVHGHYP